MPKGLINNPLRCRHCFELNAMATGLCIGCTGTLAKRQAGWPADADEQLREMYATVASAKQLSTRLRAFEARNNLSPYAVRSRCADLDLRFISRRAWTIEETSYIDENISRLSVKAIAKNLKRSYRSTEHKVREMGIRVQARKEGYTGKQLSELLSVSEKTIATWELRKIIHRSWLSGRFTEPSVRRFLRDHLNEINIRRADPVWLVDELSAIMANAELESGLDKTQPIPQPTFRSSAFAA